MHYCLRGSRDQVVGLKLNPDELGSDIYEILDWADAHFQSYSVEQTDDHVYVRSSTFEEVADIHEEPLRTGRSEGESGRSASRDEGQDDGGSAAEPALP